MMFTECQTCKLVLNVQSQETSNPLFVRPEWFAGFPCVRTSCHGLAIRVRPQKGTTISAEDYYRALHGLAYNTETVASVDRVTKLLLHRKVVRIDSQSVGHPERTIIHKLVLEGGVVLNFASSNFGACVYSIEGFT